VNVVERQNCKARHVGFFLLVLVLREDEILFVLFLVLRVMGVKYIHLNNLLLLLLLLDFFITKTSP